MNDIFFGRAAGGERAERGARSGARSGGEARSSSFEQIKLKLYKIKNFRHHHASSAKQSSNGHVFDSRWVLLFRTYSSVVERSIAVRFEFFLLVLWFPFWMPTANMIEK